MKNNVRHCPLSAIALTFSAVGITTGAAYAAPFEACPTEAFLIQTPADKPITYGVDLSTGSFNTLSPDMQTTKVNGVGFSYQDNYMYGWDYAANSLARIGSDYVTQPLTVSGLIDLPFYVGDVAIADNVWFGFRPGQGLFSIDLSNPNGPFEMVKIADSTVMGNPKLTDFAFHPTNGLIYAVDNNGFLLTINPVNGNTTVIKEVLNEPSAGFNFTFGAQYFDVENNLYISNNGNGYIYKIDLNAPDPTAVFFAYGPISQSNDGARCALAPVVATLGLDFGDAPDSYGTLFETSGPRHGESALYLGASLDTESDAYAYPLSDDTSDGNDDDDGISFVTGLEVNEEAMLVAEASQAGGFLNAWIDWDQNGTFSNDEKIITTRALNAGANNILFTVPSWAEVGTTWARFRISSTENIGPTGGVSDGEVEDYQVTVTESGVTLNFYPSQNSYTTIAFEDFWPIEGDFDMNDLLMNLRITEVIKAGEIIRLEIEGRISALGASYTNGFGIQLPTIPAAAVRSESITLEINGLAITEPVLEENQNYAVLKIMDNVAAHTNTGEGLCKYFRTEVGCGSAERPRWKVTVPLRTAISELVFPEPPYDPFIFATPGGYHGSHIVNIAGEDPGRTWEVHLKNKAPTTVFNTVFLNKRDDQSDAGTESYYQNAQGMAFAIEVPEDWHHPLEKVSIREAYPQFEVFAASGGTLQSDWYTVEKANLSNVFQD